MGRKEIEAGVSDLEREQLRSMSRSGSLPHPLVCRAEILLMAVDDPECGKLHFSANGRLPAWSIAFDTASLHQLNVASTTKPPEL